MTLSALGIFSAAGAGGAPQTYELIETQILGSTQSSITFSNLGNFSSTYRHLQIRSAPKSNSSAASGLGWVRLNGSLNGNTTDSNYAVHGLFGNGSSVTSFAETSSRKGFGVASRTNENFAANVTDILDAYSSTKNKTTRTMAGMNGIVAMYSHLFNNTGSITSVSLTTEDGSSFVSGSRFSLYGIRG